MKNYIKYILFIISIFFISCKDDKADSSITGHIMSLNTVSPSDGSVVDPGYTFVAFTFDTEIWISDKSLITINGENTPYVSVSANKLIMNIEAEAGETYTVVVKKGGIRTPAGMISEKEFRTSFTVSEKAEKSREAINVMNFLAENYGVKPISGTMANVSWNINEANWIFRHTGKYPAMNCFDYIHLQHSPADWIDYSNTTVVEDWWNNNGLVSAMWHWNVPAFEGSSDYTASTSMTSFDISKIFTEGTFEHRTAIADMEKISGYLKLLKDKKIPVIWRPLHEAAGGWFWWGAKDAESYKSLWRMMYDVFSENGLDNLIWVWTSEGNDDDWYPGDSYVDIIGRDLYNNNTASYVVEEYENLRNKYPEKLISLSECGGVAGVSTMWSEGAKWSWYCVWYDYDRTVDMTDSAFENESHVFADKSWWLDAVEYSITRDNMPSLK